MTTLPFRIAISRREMMAFRLMFLVGFLAIAVSAPAGAQTAAPRGFAGGGVSVVAEDVFGDSNSVAPEPYPLSWFVEGGVFVSGPIAIGAELFHGPTRTSHYSSSAGSLTEDYQETSLLGIARVRASQLGRVACDLLAGAGIIFQHSTDSSIPRSGSNPTPFQNETTAQSPVFVLGGDAPIALNAHLAVVPAARLYIFRSEPLRGGITVVAPSTRLTLGVSGRITW
jgi:hypothetical protein